MATGCVPIWPLCKLAKFLNMGSRRGSIFCNRLRTNVVWAKVFKSFKKCLSYSFVQSGDTDHTSTFRKNECIEFYQIGWSISRLDQNLLGFCIIVSSLCVWSLNLVWKAFPQPYTKRFGLMKWLFLKRLNFLIPSNALKCVLLYSFMSIIQTCLDLLWRMQTTCIWLTK